MLPNQALEITLYLAPIEDFLTAPGAAVSYTVSDVKFMCQFVTLDAKYVQDTFSGIASGATLKYEYVMETQTQNACSGASVNNFIIHMSGVTSLIGVQHEFIADDDVGDRTKDKSKIAKSQNLTSWRIQLGPLWSLPTNGDFEHADNNPETLMVGLLSTNDALNYSEDVELDFNAFKNEQFRLEYMFQSNDELPNSGLSFEGTDGLYRLVTKHSVAPPTNVQLVTTMYENKTLLIGQGVDVI
ncbi:hypothetical protein HK104_009132 [Borealophlyctis nickersoniae]|nr:hypothetical protein HK104_009132 [Borealophlyctis nickersoniae]